MATNITVYDLENYPDNNKTVTVDVKQVVPVGYEGDEQWVLSFVTTAYSDNTARTAIQDIYVQEIRTGWAKSSGLTSSRFTIASGSKTLGIKMDAGTTDYYIELDTGTNLDGDTIADDMETKIRAIPSSGNWSSSDDQLSYINASVEYENGKFKIISGTVSPYYTGSNRSAVTVSASGVDTCYDTLGFNLGYNSYNVANVAVNETLVTTTYSGGTTPLVIAAGTGVTAGDCLAITDGSNTEYFTALAGTTDTSVVVATTGSQGYDGISESYTANSSKVQILRMQDPDQVPVPYYYNADGIMRWGIKSITNQIDFSS